MESGRAREREKRIIAILLTCDTVPYQTACIRDTFPNPFAPRQACCKYGSYGGTTYYDWDTAHITTY